MCNFLVLLTPVLLTHPMTDLVSSRFHFVFSYHRIIPTLASFSEDVLSHYPLESSWYLHVVIVHFISLLVY